MLNYPYPSLAQDSPLADLRWKYRIILISAPSLDHPSLTAQQALLEQHPEALAERNLLILAYSPQAYAEREDLLSLPSPKQVYAYFDLPNDAFQALLIGKDGGVKMRANHLTPIHDFIGLIDQMPMRKQEMKQQGATQYK